MRRVAWWSTIAVGVIVLGGGIAAAQQYPPIDEVASVTLDTSTCAHGDTVGGVGEGFLPGEDVEVWLLSTPQLVATETADGAGVVAFSFVVPSDVEPGEHQVRLVGTTSGVEVTSSPCTTPAGESAPDAQGALPTTGQSTFPYVWVALAAIAFGTAIVVGFRRRTLARASIRR